ncbi:MAG: Spy/CpxP family protein refolding chaperone [Terracidiphilus sp.]
MKTARLVLALAGVLMAGGWAVAQGPGGEGMPPAMAQHRPPMEQAFGLAGGQFWNNPRLAQQLNLTDDQRKAMDGILQDHRMKLIDLRATLEKAEVAMAPLMKADTPDRGAIEAQIDKVVAARAELEKANSRFLLDLRLQLKPDQWKQLQTLQANRMARDGMRQHGPGQWGQGGPGPGGQFQGPGGQFRGQGQRFHGQQGPPPQPDAAPQPGAAPQAAPAPAQTPAPAPGTGQEQ